MTNETFIDWLSVTLGDGTSMDRMALAHAKKLVAVVEAAKQVVLKYNSLPDNAPALGVSYLEITIKDLERE